jgi:hypothetical protein
MKTVREFAEANKKNQVVAVTYREVWQVGWENPTEYWIVVNTDGARKLNNTSGCGGVMRGRTREWCGGFARGLGVVRLLCLNYGVF